MKASRDPGVLQLALPIIFSFWFRAAFQWVDTIYASSLGELGDASIAAIGLTAPFEFLLIACWVGTSNGLTSRLAAAMGARQGERIKQLIQATRGVVRWLQLSFLLLAAGMWILADRLPLDPVVAQQFKLYGPALLGGSALTSFWAIIPDSLVKAHNDMRSTMWAGVISTLVNFTLNTVFVFVFHWGILGIALATVLARLGGLAYATRIARHHETARVKAGLDVVAGVFKKPLKAILSLSIPAGLSFALLAVEGLAVNGVLASRPESEALLAAWAIIDRASRFLLMPIVAIGVVLLPLCARMWGTRNLSGIKRELSTGLLLALGYSIFFALPLTSLLASPVASGLTDGAAAREAARLGLLLVPLGVLLGGPMFMLRSSFEGMQEPRPGLLASALRSLLFVVPLVLLGLHLAPRFGHAEIQGLMIGASIAAGLSSLLLGTWMRAFLRTATDHGSEPHSSPPPV